jgi:hypothetical protein
MRTRPEVVHELRSLFKEGATPSALIRHVIARHEGERNLHPLIQAYFREAFGVPIVRGLSPTDDYRQADLRCAFLNEQLAHEMVQRRGEWDSPGGDESGGAWLDALSASDDQQRLSQLQAPPPELGRCWPQLTPSEQSFIQRSLASANGLYEAVKILSRLAECLQQKIVRLEAGAPEEPDPLSCGNAGA